MEIFKLWSVKTALVFAFIAILFVIPITGLFLLLVMAAVGPVFWGIIPHLLTVALIIDIQTKKLSRLFWIIPIVIYGGYYTYYYFYAQEIKSIQNELRATNPQLILNYDSEKHSLVTNDNGNLGLYYRIPVTYDENHLPLGFSSHRTSSDDLCKKARAIGLKVSRPGWGEIRKDSRGRSYYFNPKYCQIVSSEKPEKNLLKVVVEKNDNSLKNYNGVTVRKKIYNFYLNGKFVGKFTEANITRLPYFPLYIMACGPDSSSWKCFASLHGTFDVLDTFPEEVNGAAYGTNPVAILLGIKKYTEDDLLHFKDYDETIKFVQQIKILLGGGKTP